MEIYTVWWKDPASYLTKLMEAFTMLSALYRDKASLITIIIAAILLGSLESTDLAFIKIAEVAGEHRKFQQFEHGIIPAPRCTQQILLFHHVANFPLIPWAMAKWGPFAWFVIRITAASELKKLLDMDSPDTPTFLFYVFDFLSSLQLVSAALCSCVFSVYNVNKLGKALPTRRDFKLKLHDPLEHPVSHFASCFFPALLSAVPCILVLTILLSSALGSGVSLMLLPIITLLFTLSLSLSLPWIFGNKQQPYVEAYQSLFEFRFLPNALQWFDSIAPLNKSLLLLVSTSISATGYFTSNNPHESHPIWISNSLLMLTLTSLGGKHRSFMQTIRYAANQSPFYAFAFMQAILNFGWPLYNVMNGIPAENHPKLFTVMEFGLKTYSTITFLSLLSGWLAAIAEYYGTGLKDESLNKPVGATPSLPFFRREPENPFEELIDITTTTAHAGRCHAST